VPVVAIRDHESAAESYAQVSLTFSTTLAKLPDGAPSQRVDTKDITRFAAESHATAQVGIGVPSPAMLSHARAFGSHDQDDTGTMLVLS
jgi:hypothetical protein